MGEGGQHHAPAALLPGKTQYPLYRRMGGLQGWYGRVRKISSPPGLDPRSVQPVASRYTDRAMVATSVIVKSDKIRRKCPYGTKLVIINKEWEQKHDEETL